MTPAVSLLDRALLGLGEKDLGGGDKGGTCGQEGSSARDPWGVTRPTPSCAPLPTAPQLFSAVARPVACPQRPPPCQGCRPPKRRRAAWAAGGENCEAAGSGFKLLAAGTLGCFSEMQLPLPSPPRLPPCASTLRSSSLHSLLGSQTRESVSTLRRGVHPHSRASHRWTHRQEPGAFFCFILCPRILQLRK